MASNLPRVPWRPRQAIWVFLLPWLILPTLAILVLAVAAPFAPSIHTYLNAVGNGDPRSAFGLVAVQAVGSYLLINHYLHKSGVGWDVLGFRKFSLLRAFTSVLLIFIGFSLAIGIIYALVTLVFPHFNASQPQVNEFTQNTSPSVRIYDLLALVIIPPLIEEPVFRGFMFPAFAKAWGPWLGALLSSALFGLAHLQANVSVYTFVLGLLLCWLYRRLGSIIPGMALHMLNNYIAYIGIMQK